MAANQGKIVLITGATSGFGRATARLMLCQGAKVIITGRNEKALRETAEEIGASGYVCADVASWEDWERVRSYVAENFGRLDVLINNAGAGVVIKDLDQQSLTEIRRCIDINLMGPLYGIRCFAPLMKAQNSGTIINLSSVCATHAWEGYSVYAAAKAGVLSLSKSAYVELQPWHIRVTCVIPGAGATNFQINAQDRPLEDHTENLKAEDMAEAICGICALAQHVVVEDVTVWGSAQVVRPL